MRVRIRTKGPKRREPRAKLSALIQTMGMFMATRLCSQLVYKRNGLEERLTSVFEARVVKEILK